MTRKSFQAKNLLQALPRSCWIPYEPDDQKQAQQAIVDQAQKQQAQQTKAAVADSVISDTVLPARGLR